MKVEVCLCALQECFLDTITISNKIA